MAKRTKKMRSSRSAFKLEALEQRQLLATVTGAGSEVGSNITVSGKTYDQILMTGSSVTVQADANQIVRVDFLDASGDIVRAEYSGAGSLTINLADTSTNSSTTPVSPSKYTISGTKYVTGLASFTVTGSDASSNINVYSLGTGNAFNGLANPIFANGTTTGGDHLAQVARLVIIGDATNPVNGVGSAFGSITAGNAIFTDSSGVVGIYAPNTSFKTGSKIIIGDIVPTSTATPVINIGSFSDVKTVTVAGGTLKSASGGNGYQFSAGVNFVSTTGTDSGGTALPTQTLANSQGTVTYSSGLGTVTIDGTTATTASLDALYKGSYLQDVIINGGLAAGVTFHALQFGTVTVNGNLAGIITTDANDNNNTDGSEQSIGNVTVNGDIVDGGYIESARSISSVTVTGKVTHTTVAPSVNITVNGISTPTANAQAVITTLSGNASIGNVNVTGDITLGSSTTALAESFIIANRNQTGTGVVTGGGGTTGIGTITAANLTAYNTGSSSAVIQTYGSTQGTGAMTFSGDVLVSNALGLVESGRGVGNITAKSLTITATTANKGIVSTTTNGSIGNITTTGGNLTFVQGGIVSTSSIGAIAVKNSGNFYLGTSTAGVANANSAPITAAIAIGSITIDAGNFTTGTNAAINANAGGIGAITLSKGTLALNSLVKANGGNIGDITLTDSSAAGSTIAAGLQAAVNGGLGGAIGNITVSKGDLTISGAGAQGAQRIQAGTTLGNINVAAGNLTISGVGTGLTATNSIGNISVGGNFTITGVANAATVGGAAVSSPNVVVTNASGTIGNVAVSGGALLGTDASVEFQANQIGNVSVTGASGTATLIKDVIFSAKGTTQSTISSAKIGNVTLNSSANATGDIAQATSVSTSAITGTGFSSSGSIGNVSITTGAGAGAEIVNGATGNLLFVAGSSNMGAAANVTNAASAAAAAAAGYAVNTTNAAVTTDNVEAVSIGDVSITGNLSAGSNLAVGNAAGTGLIVASGVNLTTAGAFRPVTTAAANVTPAAALTAGSIGNVTLSDVSGGVVKTPFSNAVLKDIASNDNGGSIIIADKIGSITVNSGPGAILSLPNLSGLPLKGALGSNVAVPDSTKQEFVGSAGSADSLLIVVL
jgi:hypothetical protein